MNQLVVLSSKRNNHLWFLSAFSTLIKNIIILDFDAKLEDIRSGLHLGFQLAANSFGN